MKRPLLLALLLAVPLEAASFYICPFPIDVGLPDNAGWFAQVMGVRWVLMHMLGLWMGNCFGWNARYDAWCVPIGGYIEVAILLYLALLLARWLRARRQITRQNFS